MENTTNINDLPIDNNPPTSMELPEQMIREQVRPDSSVYEEPQDTKKRVRFSLTPKPSGYALQEKHKIILLAMVFFLLFGDTKVKIYLMNILVVIFGDSLRTSGGGTSKMGLIAYTLLFGITLFMVVSVIDLSALSF